jgi:FMN phosphatase YigB (HAD superfamily)
VRHAELILGSRKPEPEFYLLACKRNEIRPQEAIFLDDLGLYVMALLNLFGSETRLERVLTAKFCSNLKVAKQLGMETIREWILHCNGQV